MTVGYIDIVYISLHFQANYYNFSYVLLHSFLDIFCNFGDLLKKCYFCKHL